MIRPFVANVRTLTCALRGPGQNAEGWLGTLDREGDRRDDHNRSACICGVKMTRKRTASYSGLQNDSRLRKKIVQVS